MQLESPFLMGMMVGADLALVFVVALMWRRGFLPDRIRDWFN